MSIRKRIATVGMVAAGVGMALTVPSALDPAPAAAANYYGAIGFSPSTGATTRAWDYPSEQAAADAALSICYQSDCKVAVTFVNGCGAIAESPNYWGYGRGSSLAEASAHARYNAGGGYIYDWVCTSGHS